MSEGEAGHEMFLIMKGTVAISKGGQVLGQLSDGSFFGEMAILTHGGRESIRKRTATASSTCDLCFLGRETVAVLCLDCPELRENIERFAKSRMRRGMWVDQSERAQNEQDEKKAQARAQERCVRPLANGVSRWALRFHTGRLCLQGGGGRAGEGGSRGAVSRSRCRQRPNQILTGSCEQADAAEADHGAAQQHGARVGRGDGQRRRAAAAEAAGAEAEQDGWDGRAVGSGSAGGAGEGAAGLG